MAIRTSLYSIGIITLLALAGCASTQLVETLPAPNFNGPNISQAPVVIPPTPQVAPPVAIAPPKAQPKVGNVPREWIPLAGAKRQWNWIVIHHSATPSGSVRDFDREHREKGWDECGYHFVIGNGTKSGNGQVEVSSRWPKQKYGAHAKTADNRFNDHGIGICLVGNFDIDRPTGAQMQSLNKLLVYLMRTYRIPASRVLGHKETKPTDCPGRNVNLTIVRRTMQQQLATADGDLLDVSLLDEHVADAGVIDPDPLPASAELLQDVSIREPQ